MHTLTKTIATITIKNSSETILRELVAEGVRIFRLNFSHGTYSDHLSIIDTLRTVEASMNTIISIAMDTRGPEVRLELFDCSIKNVEKGETLKFVNKKDFKNIFVNIKDFSFLEVGTKIYIDDGFMCLEVVEVEKNSFDAVAKNSYKIKNNKKINFPESNMGLDFLTKKDKEDIDFACDNGLDIIFVSFTRNSADVISVKNYLKDRNILIYPKIETINAVNNFDDIVDVSDGVMIARGDLGVEVGFDLPYYQKTLLAKCKAKGKPIICATQIIESMITLTLPTKAEIMDVGNGVIDRFDCLLLSAETAIGNFPVRCAKVVRSIVESTENYVAEECNKEEGIRIVRSIFYDSCFLLEISDISDFYFLYSEKINNPIFVFSEDKSVLVKCLFYRGIFPMYGNSEEVDKVVK